MRESVYCKKWRKARRAATETEEDGNDHISQLPNQVLASILSLLPIKQAVRTCILSRRWRSVWNLVPILELSDDCALKINEEGEEFWERYIIDPRRWVRIIYHILFFRQDPIQRCSISSKFLQECNSDIEQFILILSKLGIQEIYLGSRAVAKYLVPNNLFYCQSLTELVLCHCKIILPSDFKGLSRLKTIDFSYFVLPDDVINNLISSCVHLERLTLSSFRGLKVIKIHVPNLLYLNINSLEPISICLENAACLLNVSVYFNFSPDISKLVFFLRSLTNVELMRLQWPGRIVGCLPSRNMLESLPVHDIYLNLKKLVMPVNLMSSTAVDLLAFLLRNSPYVQDLRLRTSCYKVRGTPVTRKDYWEKQKAFDCLANHLRTVQLGYMNLRNEREIGFLKFLVMNARVLQKMTARWEICTDVELRNIEEELLSIRASSHARLLFTSYVFRRHESCTLKLGTTSNREKSGSRMGKKNLKSSSAVGSAENSAASTKRKKLLKPKSPQKKKNVKQSEIKGK